MEEEVTLVNGISLSDKKTLSFKVITEFSVGLCEKISSECTIQYLRLLEEILMAVSCRDLVRGLVKAFSEAHSYEPDSPFGFFQNLMLKWIEVSGEDEGRLSCVFRSVFIICSQIEEEEAWKILNCCCKTKILFLEHVLQTGLSFYKDQYFFKTWLATSLWSSEVVNGLQELVNEKKFFGDSLAESHICIYYKILTICLADNYRKPLLDDASFETIIRLIHTLCDQLIGLEMNNNIGIALKFINQITIAILRNTKICWKIGATSSLVYYIFQINLRDVLNFKNAEYASGTLYEILDAFVDSYVKNKEAVMSDDSLISKMSRELKASIQTVKTPKQSSHILHQCSFLISSVQRAVQKHKPELNATLFVSYNLMDKLLPSEDYWNSLRQGLEMNTLHWFLKKRLFFPLLTQNEFSYNKEQALKYSLVADVVSSVLGNAMNDPTVKGEEYKKFCVHYIEKHLLYLLWLSTFCQGNGISEICEGVLTSRLKEKCVKMLSYLPEYEINGLKTQIFNLSLSDVSWSLCLQYVSEIYPSINLQNTSEELFEKTSSLQETTLLYNSVIRQVLIPHLSSKKKLLHLQELLQDISELEDINNGGFLGRMGELCCYLQSTEIEPSKDTLRILNKIFLHIIESDFENKHPSGINMHHMLIISMMSAVVECQVDILCPETTPLFQNLLLSLTEEAKMKSLDTPADLLFLNQAVVLFSSLSQLLCLVQIGECESNTGLVLHVLSNREIYENMIFLFQHVSDVFSKSKSVSEICMTVLRNLLEAVKYIPGEHFVNVLVAQHAESEDVVSESKTPSVLHTLISTLTSSIRPLQFASHTMLMKIMPFLPNLVNEEASSQSEDDTEEEIRTPAKLAPLIELLSFLNEIVDSMLLGIKIGDLSTVMPYTDSYVYSMAYLFAWMELFEFFSASPAQVRLGYALHLEEKLKLLTSLFSNLLRLMPENPILCLKKGLEVETPRKEDLKLLFIYPPVLKSDTPNSEEIQSIACYVYASALRKVPAVIRTWFNNLDRKSSDIVNSFTTKYISGLLCMEEIQAVHENEKLFENLVVQARPGSREVSATYSIDDCKIELCVQLPVNYPLGPITSERRGKVVIGQHEWRHWLMQLTTVLAYQNGTIIDGLNIWKKNLDKKFEGVEECMICYYILHSSTLKLPKLSCHVCRKKFHSACLYKWFRTSNNFTCPLCRNEFIC